jgi:transposase
MRRESFHLPKLSENTEEMKLDKAKAPFLNEEDHSQILLEEPLPAPRHLAWMLLRDSEQLDEQEEQILAFIRQERIIHQAYTLAQQFVAMVQNRQGEYFDTWLQDCKTSDIPDVQTFAEGLQKEYAAVKAALTYPYSNGPVEGNITKLKFIKRSLYGRGNFELLRQKVLKSA